MSPPTPAPVLVLGAGIVGLTTAIRLHEAGHPVTIIAQETPETILDRDNSVLRDTPAATYTSSGSGGLWMPYILEGGEVEGWSRAAYQVFVEEAPKKVGVWMRDAYKLRKHIVSGDMPWYAELTGMKVVTPEEDERVPKEYGCALKFRTPIVDMAVYLKYLQERLKGMGVGIELTGGIDGAEKNSGWDGERVLEFVKERWGEEEVVVVNCFGIGAGMVSGEEMVPVRGVIVRLKAREGWDYMISEDSDDGIVSEGELVAYGIPRGDREFLLGGTALTGDWRETATAEEVEGVKKRAGVLLGGLEEVEEVGIWAGLRPARMDGRARVEVQKEGIGEKLRMVANYGHGGCGVTASWGCADRVVELVSQLSS